jgi:hypothetical protein
MWMNPDGWKVVLFTTTVVQLRGTEGLRVFMASYETGRRYRSGEQKSPILPAYAHLKLVRYYDSPHWH